MNIVKASNDFLQSLIPTFQPKIHTLLEFGFKSISLQRIVSLNSNARSSVSNPHTAESKIFRLTKTIRFLKYFPNLISQLGLLSNGDSVAIDFSDFGGFQVLMFAKRTNTGRALPVYFEILTYPIEKDSQNIFVITAIKNFCTYITPLDVSFVFDRGFACPAIIEYLFKNKLVFYIRIKSCKTPAYKTYTQKARDFNSGVHLVKAYENKQLTLTVTPAPPGKPGKLQEPWYIISNDVWNTAKTITEIYYHRFEIEEFFKEAKRLFGLEYIRFKKYTSLSIILWFVMLNFWLQRYLLKTAQQETKQDLIKKCKTSWNQSFTHYWLEQLKFFLMEPVLFQISLQTG